MGPGEESPQVRGIGPLLVQEGAEGGGRQGRKEGRRGAGSKGIEQQQQLDNSLATQSRGENELS